MVDHTVTRPLSRRTFLKTGAATGGALVLGVYLPDRKAAAALLKSTPKPTDDDIDAAMSGNVCRCGTYQRIRTAIHRTAG